MVSHIEFNTRVVERPVTIYEEVEVQDTPSIIFEGDDVGHLLYVLYRLEGCIFDSDGNILYPGGHFSNRLENGLGSNLWNSLVADFERRTGAYPILLHQEEGGNVLEQSEL